MNLGTVTYKDRNVLMFPKEAGIEPLSAFFWRSIDTRFVRLPNDGGIGPDSLFPSNLLWEHQHNNPVQTLNRIIGSLLESSLKFL